MTAWFGRAQRLLTTCLVLSFLAACQTIPEQSAPDQEWQTDASIFTARAQQYNTLNSWRYAAKVGLTAPQVREAANIVWQYQDQANNVRLFGPLGMGAVRLQFDQYGVVLSDNQGVLHRGESAEELLTKIVGWPIPLDALSRWLFVLPMTGSVYRYQVDAADNVAVLEQLGWQIEYSAYKAYLDKFLPRKIVATKQLADGQTVVVKLISKSWQW